MKAQWVDGDEEGNLYIKLIPANEQERKDLEEALHALITGYEERPASLYGEPDDVVYGISAREDEAVLTGPNGEPARCEIRIF